MIDIPLLDAGRMALVHAKEITASWRKTRHSLRHHREAVLATETGASVVRSTKEDLHHPEVELCGKYFPRSRSHASGCFCEQELVGLHALS